MDREVLAAAADSFPEEVPAAKREALAWTAREVSAASVAFLAALPEQRRLALPAGAPSEALVVHGSPAGIDEHLWPHTPD